MTVGSALAAPAARFDIGHRDGHCIGCPDENHRASRLLVPSTSDSLDSLTWDEVNSDLLWQEAGAFTALTERGRRRALTVNQTTPFVAVRLAVADHAVLDEVFARTTNANDQTADDE